MSNLYELPIRYQGTTITRELSSAIHEFVLHAIEEECPEEQQPGEFADSLIAIAESYGVPIEALGQWIRFRRPGKEWTTTSFRKWAEGYREVVTKIRESLEIRQLCPKCWMPLERVDLGDGLALVCGC